MKHFASFLGVCTLLSACSSGNVTDDNTNGTGSGGTGTGGSGIDIGIGGSGGHGSGTGGTGTGGNAAGTGGACGQSNYKLERQPAELLLVLDRSGSMKDEVMGVAKWNAVTPAVDKVIKATDSAIFWGLELFPTGSSMESCKFNAAFDPDLKISNYTPMSNAIAATGLGTAKGLGSGTPTRAAINAAVTHLQGRTTPNPKYIVLATDGAPNCKDGNAGTQDDDGAVAAVKAAAVAGFHTFVIGIAADTEAGTTLTRMATEGKEPRAGQPNYYSVSSEAQLVTALTEITGQIANCVFPLTTVPPVPDNVAVNLGGVRVAQDTTHKNGWDYGAGMKSILLYGAACDSVKAGTAKMVDIIYGCPGKVIE